MTWRVHTYENGIMGVSSALFSETHAWRCAFETLDLGYEVIRIEGPETVIEGTEVLERYRAERRPRRTG